MPLKARSSIDLTAFRDLYPFRSHYAQIGGHRCHYLDEVRGRPVVMLRGNPTWSFYFRRLVTELSPQYRVIAPDHIGCGLSDKPAVSAYDYRLESRVRDLEHLLDALAVRSDITLIGHDWGGMIGLVYALRHLERVRCIVLMNTSGFFPPGGRPVYLPLRIILAHLQLALHNAVLPLKVFGCYLPPCQPVGDQVDAVAGFSRSG